MDTLQKLSAYFREKGIEIRVIAILKTIDNDICVTDHTRRFVSAVKYVAAMMRKISHYSAVYSISRAGEQGHLWLASWAI